MVIDLGVGAYPHRDCGRVHPLGPCPWLRGDRVQSLRYGFGTVMHDTLPLRPGDRKDGHGKVSIALDSGRIVEAHVSMERLISSDEALFTRVILARMTALDIENAFKRVARLAHTGYWLSVFLYDLFSAFGAFFERDGLAPDPAWAMDRWIDAHRAWDGVT